MVRRMGGVERPVEVGGHELGVGMISVFCAISPALRDAWCNHRDDTWIAGFAGVGCCRSSGSQPGFVAESHWKFLEALMHMHRLYPRVLAPKT